MAKAGRKNTLELFCVHTGVMQQSPNDTGTEKAKQCREETATGQSSGTKTSSSLAWGGGPWLRWDDENLRHLRSYFHVFETP